MCLCRYGDPGPVTVCMPVLVEWCSTAVTQLQRAPWPVAAADRSGRPNDCAHSDGCPAMQDPSAVVMKFSSMAGPFSSGAPAVARIRRMPQHVAARFCSTHGPMFGGVSWVFPGVEVAGSAQAWTSGYYSEDAGYYMDDSGDDDQYHHQDVFSRCYTTSQISGRAALTEGYPTGGPSAWLQVWQVQQEACPAQRRTQLWRPAVAALDAQVCRVQW
jgi:hypothetical protein